MTGALFVFTRMDDDEYTAYLLNTEDEIDAYLAALALGPQDTGRMIQRGRMPMVQSELQEIIRFVSALGVSDGAEFPVSDDVSHAAREIQERVYDHAEQLLTNPDSKLVEYKRVEYALFRELEHQAYGERIARGFADVESFVELANRVLNRRKSRVGKSLEHHLAAIFNANGLAYEPQVRTEGNKKPDFVFPSEGAYHNPSYPVSGLVVLAAKTTYKDRWRQILKEANRTKDGTHYLIKQGNSNRQLEEMTAEHVQLVVPRQYHSAYPMPYRSTIWLLKRFILFVCEKGLVA